MTKAVLIKAADNVATSLENIDPGTGVTLSVDGERVMVMVVELIPFGHKFAVREIAVGEMVIKYGEPIGVANQVIKAGEHVHIHNIESRRGRGDR